MTPIISAFLKSVTFAVNGEVYINTSGVLTCVGGVDSQCVRACVRAFDLLQAAVQVDFSKVVKNRTKRTSIRWLSD